jgi:hypothetical protein
VPLDSTICTYVANELTGTGFTVACSSVQVSPAQDARVNAFNGAGGAYRGPVTVDGSYKFTFITPLISSLFGGSIMIHSAATMRAGY